MREQRRKLTPPEIAARYGISPDKVVGWIRAGELRAINGATRPGGRPRYLIDETDIADFEARRAVLPTAKPAPPRRRRQPADVIEFF